MFNYLKQQQWSRRDCAENKRENCINSTGTNLIFHTDLSTCLQQEISNDFADLFGLFQVDSPNDHYEQEEERRQYFVVYLHIL